MNEKQARKFRQARDQMYNYSVHIHAIRRENYPRHPTPELLHLVDLIEDIVEQHLAAFMEGNIIAVTVDCYTPAVLPGFDALLSDRSDPLARSGLSADDLGDTSTLDDIPY